MIVASLPFVGRAEELEALDGLFVAAAEGTGGALAVEGVTGVGKTHLVEKAIDTALARWPEALVAECRCSQHSDPLNPSGPFATLLASMVRPEKATKRLAETVLRVARSTAPDWAATLPIAGAAANVVVKSVVAALDSPSPFAASPYGAADSLILQYSSMLGHLAREGTQIILVLEDAQWLARPGYELLASIAQTATAAGIALVVTYDPRRLTSETPLVQELSRIQLRAGMERMPLRGLAEPALAASLRLRYDAELDRRFPRWLAELCAGNPLVVAHYLDYLERRGDIAVAASHGVLSSRLLTTIVDWDAGVALPESQLPPALEEMLRLRVDQLEEDDRELLRMASVQGTRFDPRLVAVLAERSERKVARRLRKLERTTGLVAFAEGDDARTTADGDLYEFESGLIQSALYAGLRPRERARSHRLLAEALGDGGVHAAPDAWILGQVGRHRLAAGDGRDAAQAFLAAARAEQLDGRLLDAMELSRRARGAADGERALRAQAALCWLTSSEPWWGSTLAGEDDVWDLLFTTRDDAEAIDDLDIATGAGLAMARYLRDRGDQDAARAAMRQALAAAREGGSREAEFACLLTLGYAINSVDLREGRALLQEAEALFPMAFPSPDDGSTDGLLGMLHAYIGVAEFDGGQLGEAERRLREALALLRRSDRTPDVPRVLSFAGQLHMATGAFDEAERHFDQAVEMLAAEGAESALAAYNTALLGKLALERDDPLAAREALRDALGGVAATSNRDFELLVRTYLAELLIREGDAAGAARECEWVIHAAAEAGYPGMLAGASSLLAAAHLEAERPHDALAASTRAVEELDRLGALVLVRSEEVYLRHARVLEACEQPAAARAFVRRAAQALQAKADSLTNEAAKRRFLTAVPLNIAILSASAGLE